MPARLVQVTIINNSDYPIVWQDDGREHGFWQDPWQPSKIQNLQKGQQASFRLESGGVFTGADGWAFFKVDVPTASNAPPTTEFFSLKFSRAYLETAPFHGEIAYYLHDSRTNEADHPGPKLAYVVNHHTGPLDNYSTGLLELGSAQIPHLAFPGIGLLGEAVPLLLNESFDKHVLWVVEVRNAGEGVSSTRLPLRLAPKNTIYTVSPRVNGAVRAHGATPPSGGDLKWYQHEGRLDGSAKWEGPEKVGKRWDGLQHLFSGGEGIVYAVTPRIGETPAARISKESAASLEMGGRIQKSDTEASGGDLLWYRHVGWEDGTFTWEGPKRVGIRWDGFRHLFSGGDGVIYGVRENGDLLWYRHVGRYDGSFVWQGPEKVGVGWGGMTHVFYGGDGVIYAVTPKVEASASADVTGGQFRASGGDLLWYRHLGREDGSFNWNGPKKVGTGWDRLDRVFSDGAGVIYGVTPRVEANYSSDTLSVTTLESSGHVASGYKPASGGELMWYKHLGWAEGTFAWETPKRVGYGWNGLEHLFSGGVTAT